MKLTFFGGTKIVTGANYLLEHKGVMILVDCGLFQGSKFAEGLNYERFPYDVTKIDFLFLTHAHADHTGRVPKLYKEGFRGKIIATQPTLEITKESLDDGLGLIKDEAKFESHEPLYSYNDIDSSMAIAWPLDYEKEINLGNGIRVILHDSGHILGSAIVEIRWTDDANKNKKIYFSGDLGNPPNPLLNNPYQPKDADYAVIESAYGGRKHENPTERKELLAKTIEDTIKRNGTLMIPTFAVERTQEILYEIHQLFRAERVPAVPVFLDSPLATRCTEIYLRSDKFFNQKAQKDLKKWGGLFKFPTLRITFTTSESKKINDVRGPKIIIAGSGMSNGGRILHHEIRYLPDPNSTILFVGYQVNGSLGRRIFEGEKEVGILGQKVAVNCKVEAIGGYSAHADQPALAKWVEGTNAGGALKDVFMVQGEEESATALAQVVSNDIKVRTHVPESGQSFEL